VQAQLLLSIIESIHSAKGHYPGKKELQKSVYLLQKKGLDLGYSYRFYFYGPYSDALDEDIQRLAIQGLLTINHEEMTHRITVKSSLEGPIEDEIAELIQSTANELKDIPPVQLELMTTILFIINNNMVPESYTEDDIVHKVRDLKGDKYAVDEVKEYYRLLINNKYIQ
jgi:uncharacterized protein YwgA